MTTLIEKKCFITSSNAIQKVPSSASNETPISAMSSVVHLSEWSDQSPVHSKLPH